MWQNVKDAEVVALSGDFTLIHEYEMDRLMMLIIQSVRKLHEPALVWRRGLIIQTPPVEVMINARGMRVSSLLLNLLFIVNNLI